MHITQLNSKWKREPIFAADSNHIPAYFCHLFYNDLISVTARAEEVGDGEWEAMIVDLDGHVIHMMDEVYPTHRTAIEDVVGWYIGQ